MRLSLPLVLALAAESPALGLTLAFPGPATATASTSEAMTSYPLPIGPWADGAVPVRVMEGRRSDTAWRVAGSDLTTLQLLAALREQVVAEGYEVLWDCATDACGGFDFRFAIETLSEPEMHVDLGDFRFLAAERSGPSGPEALAILVSRSQEAGFVQLTTIGGADGIVTTGGAPPVVPVQPAPAEALPAGTLAARLEASGAVALDDLAFESGSSRLGGGEFASLAELAAYLKANPSRTVALVGHTDASGSLAANVALSKQRAASVRDRLIADFGVPAAQVAAEGAGFLAPRASNLTEEGRARNRRVEVMITSTP
jgi:OOP family OmpA-OmpF porin